MGLFSTIFNKSSIYDMLFFNVKSVLEYPTIELLKENSEIMYERWVYLSKQKYGDTETTQKTYEENAVNHPEFTKIVAITYATLYSENGTIKRFFKKIYGESEFETLGMFMDVLHQLSSEGVKSTPNYFPALCGYNIIISDIPLLIKRFIKYRNDFQNKQIPFILKKSLDSKPWESDIIDLANIWKFNGFDYAPLALISDYFGVKKNVDKLYTKEEISKYYWDNYPTNPKETLEFITLQSANQTNVVIQIINELRQM